MQPIAFLYRDTTTHARMLDNNTAMNVKNCKNQLKNFSQFNNFVFSVIIIPNSKKSFFIFIRLYVIWKTFKTFFVSTRYLLKSAKCCI